MVAAALGSWAYSLGQGRSAPAPEPVEPARRTAPDESEQLKSENAELRQRIAQSERQVEIERATYAELTKQVKSLAAENASLKEDLSFFQTLMPPAKGDQALSVNRFGIEKQLVPGEYRYRLLLLHMAPFGAEFTGSYQLVVELVQNGAKREISFPRSDAPDSGEFRLRFKSYQRVEGLIKVPEDGELRRVQIRVFEEGSKNPRLAQTINVSPGGALDVHSKR